MKLPRYLLFSLSGILLTLLFPRFSFSYLAWIALIPMLKAAGSAVSRKQAILGGWLTGLIFYGISLFWLIHIAWFGWVFVVFLETFFLGLFSLLVYEGSKIKEWYFRIFWIASSWTLCEILRSEMPIFGLPWNLLAYSQSDVSIIRLSANAVGAYGLGFVIAWINASLLQFWRDFWKLTQMKFWYYYRLGRMSLYEARKPAANLALLLAALGMLLGHGMYYEQIVNDETGTIKVSVIQGNIPQESKWDILSRTRIIEVYLKLTQLLASDQPHLIVWPEAAFPGYFNMDVQADRVKDLAKEIKIPLLLGALHSENPEIAYNSAYFVNEHGHISKRYDKQFLVPFGEYVPIPLIFGWLKPFAQALGVSDFYEGKEATVFQLRKMGNYFSTLICFEDVFPSLARQFVNRGARFLLVITNDAWFKDSQAPYQHLQASIFRAIENGVPVIRAANTGISAFIDKKGNVTSKVQDSEGKDIFVLGTKTENVNFDEKGTFYRSLGHLFPYAMILGLFFLMCKGKKNPTFLFDVEIEDEK